MARRTSFFVVAALLVVPFIAAAQTIPTSVCPKSSNALVIEPFGSSYGTVGPPITHLQNQGFSVTRVGDPGKVSIIGDALRQSWGVLIYFGHGSPAGISGEQLPYSVENIVKLRFQVSAYEAMGETDLAVTWDPQKTFCCIEMGEGFINSKTNGERALVINASCQGSSYASSWNGSRVVLSYSTSPFNTDMLSGMNTLFHKLCGGSGDAYRYVNAAAQGLNYVSYGNGELVLSPVVLSITPTEGSILNGDVDGTILFNAKMKTSDAKRIVLGTGELVISGQQWDDDHTISYTAEPICQGVGRVNVIAAQAVAEGGANRYLDGDGDGTYNDDYWAEYTVSNDVHCDNQAVSLSALWVVQDADAARVEWVADVERNTQLYTVVGQPGDIPLTTVPVKSGVGPHAYSVAVPSGYFSYGLSETETCGKVNMYRSATLAPAPAERVAALAIDATPLPAGPHAIAPEPQGHTPIDGGGEGGGGSPVAQIVIVGPDSLQQELGPAINAWRSDGLRVDQFSTTSPDPEPIQAYLAQKKHDADALHEAYPWVMILGDANEGGEPAKNIVSTFYRPDSTGGAFFGNDYPTDDPYSDFDHDGIADFQTFRLPADQRVEVRNAVQTFLVARQTHNASRSLLLLTGDVDEAGNPSANVVLGAQTVHDRYAAVGFQVNQLLDSSFPYNDHSLRQQAFANQISASVSEIWGRAPLSNRSIWPGYFAQKAYVPAWNWSWVTSSGTPFMFWAPGCDVADYDRNNPVFDPTLAEQFLFVGPSKPSAVAIISCSRGAYGLAHDCFEQLLLEARFTPGLRTSLDVFWYAKREFTKRFPGFIGYVQAMTFLGWPTLLPEYTQTGVAEVPTPPPALLAAAPNPFSSSTTIHFALEQDAHVRVDVVDVQGRLIQTLVDEVRQAGDVAVHWDGSHVANGIYYVRAKTPTRTTTVGLTHIR